MAEFNLDAKLAESENNEGKVQQSAVEKAKANIAEKKAQQEAAEVERRLAQAEKIEKEALKKLRYDRAKESAQKKYLTDLNAAKDAFETTGNYRAYDDAVEKAEDERDKAINDAKRKIYGDDYWRY